MKPIWFKRRPYGWGWYPATWQAWLILTVWLALVIAFAFTIDEDSPPREVAFTFILPIIFLTSSLLLIAYRTGEPPRWQWGQKDEKDQ